MTGKDQGGEILWIMTDGGSPAALEWPEWLRSAAIADGIVFLPAVIAGNELEASLCACWDSNVRLIQSDGHVYLPAKWLASEFPRIREDCEAIERRVFEAAARLS
jgi:hypothetical protein